MPGPQPINSLKREQPAESRQLVVALPHNLLVKILHGGVKAICRLRHTSAKRELNWVKHVRRDRTGLSLLGSRWANLFEAFQINRHDRYLFLQGENGHAMLKVG